VDRPEFNLIDWIRRRVTDRAPVTLGIGDDAAALQVAGDRELLVATDMLMEGVHFTFPPATPQLAGRKALAVNLSDIAAMAGRATAAFVSVALPVDRGFEFAQNVHAGLLDLADEYDLVLAGGDTNSWNGPLVINVAVAGEPLGARPVLRSGAQPGDWLFVTGSLGGSLAGRHLTFAPRLHEVKRLVDMVELHAMLDISDGLAADLHHILNQSRVGAILDAERIPLSAAAIQQTTADRSALSRALGDGEDFELLFAVSPADGLRLESLWRNETPVTRIGQLTAGPGCWLKDGAGQLVSLPPLGWTHALASARGTSGLP
jgi:thiamine-monophosphate kinase